MAAKLSDIGRFFSSVKRLVYNTRFLKDLGAQGVDIIYKRVKSGKGVINPESISPKKVRLKSLSPAYIKERRDRGVKGKFGEPAFSNLTDTGQMLDSMTVVDVRADGFRIIIPNTQRRNSPLTNSKVAEFVAKQGRPFLAFTKDERRILEVEVDNQVRKAFNSVF